MKYRSLNIFLTLFVAICSIASNAAVVTTDKPGHIDILIDGPLSSEHTLIIHGPVDATDLFFIAREIGSLDMLDLSDATIEACDTIIGGLSRSYPAGLLPEAVFAGSRIKQILLPRHGKVRIADMAFVGSELEEITLASNVVNVGIGAFSACKSLTNAKFSGSTSLATHVFSSCPELTTVTLNAVDTIKSNTFADCRKLSTVIGSSTLKYIGNAAFLDCHSLSEFKFGEILEHIGESAFAGCGLKFIDMTCCYSLTAISDWAFANCSAVESVTLPDCLTHIGQGAFFDCTGVTTAPLPASVKTICDYAFKGLSSVDNMLLPSSLAYIGDLAMSGMTGLKTIYANDLNTVPELGDDVWDKIKTNVVTLYVTDEMVSEFKSTPQWQDFDIISDSTSNSDVVNAPSATTIRATIEGSHLLISSIGADLKTLDIYNLSGIRIYSDVNLSSTETIVDISVFTDKLLIVSASTADGIRGVIKINKM